MSGTDFQPVILRGVLLVTHGLEGRATAGREDVMVRSGRCSTASRAISAALTAAAVLLIGLAAPAFGVIEAGTHIPITLETPADYPGAPVPGQPSPGWFHVLSHPGATYIAIHFVGFDLGPGDYLIVSDGKGGQEYRLEGKGKMGAGTFWARHVRGDTVVLDLVVVSAAGGRGFAIDEYVAGDLDLEGGISASVCGTDDRENAICYEASHPTAYDRGRAVVRLLTNGSAFCTGSLVSPSNHVLTNSHCISTQTKALNTDYEFMAEAPDCADPNCRDCYPGVIFSGGTLVRNSWDLDYALVQLNTGDPASAYGYLEVDNRAPLLGEQIYFPQHPGGRAKEFALFSTHPSDTGGVARIQSLTAAPCVGSGHDDIGYYADSEPGSSGSPILAASSHKLIALHQCGGCFNAAVPIYLIYPEIENDLLGLSSPGRIAPGAIAVTADSFTAGGEPENAIDRDIHTGWASQSAAGDHWYQLDLGMFAPVTGIKVWHASAGGDSVTLNSRAFLVQSAPGAAGPWATEFVGDNASQENVSSFTYPGTQSLRHLRVLITDPGDTSQARIREFEVIAEATIVDALSNGANIAALAVDAQASSVFGPDWGPEKAIDGVVSLESKWTSAGVLSSHTLTLDMGAFQSVGGFVLRQPSAAGEASYFNATDFSFQSARSMSGPWFTEARVVTSGAADYESRLFVAPKDLRYIRLHIDDPGIDDKARVPEFEVHAPGGAVALFNGAPTGGVVPLSVSFTDLSVGDVSSWAWDFGDDATSNAQHPSHVYNTPGTYTVSLTVDGVGGPDIETKVDYIYAATVVPADFDADGDVDQGDFGHFQACISGPGFPPSGAACEDADLDEDNDVDQSDFSILQGCMTPANVLPDPGCMG